MSKSVAIESPLARTTLQLFQHRTVKNKIVPIYWLRLVFEMNPAPECTQSCHDLGDLCDGKGTATADSRQCLKTSRPLCRPDSRRSRFDLSHKGSRQRPSRRAPGVQTTLSNPLAVSSRNIKILKTRDLALPFNPIPFPRRPSRLLLCFLYLCIFYC